MYFSTVPLFKTAGQQIEVHVLKYIISTKQYKFTFGSKLQKDHFAGQNLFCNFALTFKILFAG